MGKIDLDKFVKQYFTKKRIKVKKRIKKVKHASKNRNMYKSLLKLSYLDLINANLHYGSNISQWVPSCSYFLRWSRNNIFLFDLAKSVFLLRRGLNFISNLVMNRGIIWSFASNAMGREFLKVPFFESGHPYYIGKYKGGVVTNFSRVLAESNLVKFSLELENDCRHFFEEKARKFYGNSRDRNFFKYRKKFSSRLKWYSKNQNRKYKYKSNNFLKKNIDWSLSEDVAFFPSLVFCPDTNFYVSITNECVRAEVPFFGICDSNMRPHSFLYNFPANNDSLSGLLFLAYLVKETILLGYVKESLAFDNALLMSYPLSTWRNR